MISSIASAVIPDITYPSKRREMDMGNSLGLSNANYSIVLSDDVWKVLLKGVTLSEHAFYREAKLAAIRHADTSRDSEVSRFPKTSPHVKRAPK